MSENLNRRAYLSAAAILVAVVFCDPKATLAAEAYTPFDGAKTVWHGFDRYDFLMDEQALTVKPTAPGANIQGQRRCIVVVPKEPAPGNPWSRRGCYWDHQPQTEIELLRRGFHIVTGPVPFNSDGPIRAHWNAVYKHLTDNDLSRKPVLEGAGGAAGEACVWAIDNPDKVSCIYVENPLLRRHVTRTQPLDNLAPLAKAGVPILHLCGSLDPWLVSNTRAVEQRYQQLGGKITVIVQEGEGHLPTSPKDPKPVVDFITASVQAAGN